MTLSTTGYGKVKGASYITGDAVPSTNGALLNVGEAYSVTATPAVNDYFSDWSGIALTAFGASNGLTLHFIMESNTSITANFITNRFLGMAGLYNGLFSSAEIGTNTEETSGMIADLSLNTRGTYSAIVLLGGSGQGISGTFTPDGHATNTVLMTNGVPDGNVTVQLLCDGTNLPRTIHGWVIGTNTILLPDGTPQSGWTSQVVAVASLTNTSNFAGAYTLLIPPAANADGTNSPSGYGYAVLTNILRAEFAPAGVAFTGLLPDWSSFVVYDADPGGQRDSDLSELLPNPAARHVVRNAQPGFQRAVCPLRQSDLDPEGDGLRYVHQWIYQQLRLRADSAVVKLRPPQQSRHHQSTGAVGGRADGAIDLCGHL